MGKVFLLQILFEFSQWEGLYRTDSSYRVVQHVLYTSTLSPFSLQPYQKFLKKEGSLQREYKPHLHGPGFDLLVLYLNPTQPIQKSQKKERHFQGFNFSLFPSVAVIPTGPYFAVLHEGIFGLPWNQKDLSNLWVQLTAGQLSHVARSQRPWITSIMISKPHGMLSRISPISSHVFL